MNISLNPALEKMVQEKVNSGLYNSSSEVIRDALRLLFERDSIKRQRIEELNREIEIGLKDLENGRCEKGEKVYQRLMGEN